MMTHCPCLPLTPLCSFVQFFVKCRFNLWQESCCPRWLPHFWHLKAIFLEHCTLAIQLRWCIRQCWCQWWSLFKHPNDLKCFHPWTKAMTHLSNSSASIQLDHQDNTWWLEQRRWWLWFWIVLHDRVSWQTREHWLYQNFLGRQCSHITFTHGYTLTFYQGSHPIEMTIYRIPKLE